MYGRPVSSPATNSGGQPAKTGSGSAAARAKHTPGRGKTLARRLLPPSRIYATPLRIVGRNAAGIVVRVIDTSKRCRRRTPVPVDHHHPRPRARRRQGIVPALYHERWRSETTLDELKTHLRALRLCITQQERQNWSKAGDTTPSPDGAFCHPRSSIHAEAALKAEEDPDRLSFVHSVPRCPEADGALRRYSPSAEKSTPPAILLDNSSRNGLFPSRNRINPARRGSAR